MHRLRERQSSNAPAGGRVNLGEYQAGGIFRHYSDDALMIATTHRLIHRCQRSPEEPEKLITFCLLNSAREGLLGSSMKGSRSSGPGQIAAPSEGAFHLCHQTCEQVKETTSKQTGQLEEVLSGIEEQV
jgi:hypothetical protein